jgi:hypothetical protein
MEEYGKKMSKGEWKDCNRAYRKQAEEMFVCFSSLLFSARAMVAP